MIKRKGKIIIGISIVLLLGNAYSYCQSVIGSSTVCTWQGMTDDLPINNSGSGEVLGYPLNDWPDYLFSPGGLRYLHAIREKKTIDCASDGIRGQLISLDGQNHIAVGDLHIENSTIQDGNADLYVNGWVYFPTNYFGSFRIGLVYQSKWYNPNPFDDEADCQLDNCPTAYLDYKDVCMLAPSNIFPGNVVCSNCSSPDNGTVLMNTGNVSATIYFNWQSNNYCGPISAIRSRIQGQAWANNWTSAPDHSVTVYQTGTYIFEFQTGETVNVDGTNITVTHLSDFVTVEVAPSCHNQTDTDPDDVAPVAVYGNGVEEINGGYGNAFGGYKVTKDVSFIVDFGHDIDGNITTVDVDNNYCIIANDGSVTTSDCATISTGDITMTKVPGTDGKYEVVVNSDIGSYRIEAIKQDHLGTYCKTFDPVSIFVGGNDVVISSPCLITIPDDIPELFGIVESQWQTYILEHFNYVVSSQQGIIVEPGAILEAGAQLYIDDTYHQPQEELVDNNKNWVQKMAYDDYGRLNAESKTFYNSTGNLLQAQYKNLSDNFVMAQQPLYDKFGRVTVSTLPAPVSPSLNTADLIACEGNIQTGRNLVFNYKPDFVTQTSGTAYRHTNFDGSKLGNPDAVGNSSMYTLGWYYSNNNSLEPYVPATDFPFAQAEYYADGTNDIKSSVKPGNVYRGSSGHQNVVVAGQSQSVSATDAEVTKYLTVRASVFPSDVNAPANMNGKAYKITNTDEHGLQTANYYDNKDNLLISFHANTFRSYYFYDDAGRLKASVSPNGVKAFIDLTATYANIDKTTYEYNLQGWLLAVNEPDAGRTEYKYRKDGNIRFSQNALQRISGKYSYTHYNRSGRVFESGECDPGTTGILFADITPAILEAADATGGLTGGSKTLQLSVFYDGIGEPASPNIFPRNFTRGKVSCTQKQGVSKTWYSYDERGRLREACIYHDYTNLYKYISYAYHQNGNIKEVAYQKSFSDAFYHIYEYDADTRLKKVFTTKNEPEYMDGQVTNGALQAQYFYYLHGPLKRMEYANNIEGVDYVYTIEGNLKSINHPGNANDPGKDESNLFGMQLDYYSGDYSRTGTNIASMNTSGATQLFNGNIRYATSKTKDIGSSAEGYAFSYDNRNQITGAMWGAPDYSLGTFTNSSISKYQESDYNYDHNGNIKSIRRKNQTGGFLDDFLNKYSYTANTNKLASITGYASYGYDALGQMDQELITGQTARYYEYDATGKVTAIYTDGAHTQKTLEYAYDENGYRVRKTDIPNNITTVYVRDAAGNIMSVYDNMASPSLLALTETPIYGAGKLGNYFHSINKPHYELADHLGNVRATFSQGIVTSVNDNFNDGTTSNWVLISFFPNPLTTFSANSGKLTITTDNSSGGVEKIITTSPGRNYYFQFDITLGNDNYVVVAAVFDANDLTQPIAYEMPDNLGQTETITINFTAVSNSTKLVFLNLTAATYTFSVDNVSIKYDGTILESYSDYYPGGQLLPGRSSVSSPAYRFGYQGQFAEKDPETGFDNFELRQWDSKILRWKAPDYYGQFWSPYLGMGNNPIIGIDPDGGICPTCPGGKEYNAYRESPNQFGYNSDVGIYNADWLIEVVASRSFDAQVVGSYATMQDQIATRQRLQQVEALMMFAKYAPVMLGYQFGNTGSNRGSSAKITANAAKGALNLGEKFIASANKPWGNQGLTNAGRALQKHAGREGSVFETVNFSHKTANQEGLKIINQIMNSPNRVVQQAENGGTLVFDKTSGMGFGVSREGLFNGFRELPR